MSLTLENYYLNLVMQHDTIGVWAVHVSICLKSQLVWTVDDKM
jgi:hypothetical protein